MNFSFLNYTGTMPKETEEYIRSIAKAVYSTFTEAHDSLRVISEYVREKSCIRLSSYLDQHSSRFAYMNLKPKIVLKVYDLLELKDQEERTEKRVYIHGEDWYL